MLAFLYYFTLEENGVIYIESNNPISAGIIIENEHELFKLITTNKKNGFYYPFGNILTQQVLSKLSKFDADNINEHVINRNQIYDNNVSFLEKCFYGSTVEIITDSHTYPVSHKLYPITKYYTITKKLNHSDILSHILTSISDYDNLLSMHTLAIIKY
jgi:nitrogenase molybdenum-iron protein alpha/beta subunit